MNRCFKKSNMLSPLLASSFFLDISPQRAGSTHICSNKSVWIPLFHFNIWCPHFMVLVHNCRRPSTHGHGFLFFASPIIQDSRRQNWRSAVRKQISILSRSSWIFGRLALRGNSIAASSLEKTPPFNKAGQRSTTTQDPQLGVDKPQSDHR